MKPRISAITLGFIAILTVCLMSLGAAAKGKPSPDEARTMLQAGNERYAGVSGEKPIAKPELLKRAGTESQGDYAYATVLTCSDSRIPVERLFDVDIMDVFVVRVAGNVMKVDEIGSIEYGVAHVRTPLVVVLGHTQCGAVIAVADELTGHGHPLERNIPPLVAPIVPVVKNVMTANPSIEENELVKKAIEANVWQGVRNLFTESPAVRDLAQKGEVKVVGAIYDVGTGKVHWLPDDKSAQILAEVQKDPNRPMNPMAE